MAFRSIIRFIILCAVLLVTVSCSENRALKSRYVAEKLYHGAEKLLNKARLQNQLSNASVTDDLVTSYAGVVDYCLASLDSLDESESGREFSELQFLSFQSTSRVSQLLYAKKKYDQSVAVLERLISRVDLKGSHMLSTYLNLGQAIHAGGNWDSAAAVYDYCINAFYPPMSDDKNVDFKLFNLPYHVFKVLKISNDSAGASLQHTQASLYYLRLLQEFPNTPLESPAHANLALLYHAGGHWQDEVDQLSLITAESPERTARLRLKIGDVYAYGLGDPEKAQAAYGEVLGMLGPEDSALYAVTLFKLTLIKMDQGRYGEARRDLQEIKKNYRRYYESNPSVQLLLARSFDLDGKWNRAEIEYNLLIEKYRTSDEALATFLYVADYFVKKGRKSESDRWYLEAEKAYSQLSVLGTGTGLEAKALLFMADLFRQKKEWQKAAETLVDLFEKFPTSQPGRSGLRMAVSIYTNQLNNKAIADSLQARLNLSMARIDAVLNK